MPTLTSDRVNYLVWRYLQEEGLNLSAYAVNKETHAGNLDPGLNGGVPEGELVRLILRGIELAEIEAQTLDGNTINAGTLTTKSDLGPGASIRDTSATPTPAPAPPSDAPALPGPELPQTNGFEIKGEPVLGGLECVYTDEYLVVAGIHEIAVYDRKSGSRQALECGERPTCVVKESTGVLVGYMSGSVRQWRLDTQPFVLQSVLTPEIDAPMGPVLLVKRSITGARAAVVYLNGLICIWDLLERQMLNFYNAPSSDHDNSRLSMVSDVAWLGGDQILAVSHSTGVAVINLELPPSSPPTFLTKRAHKEGVPDVAQPVAVLEYDPVMQLLAGGSDDGRVYIWNSAGNTPLRELIAGQIPAPVSHVSWLGVYLLTGSTDGSLRVFDVRKVVSPESAGDSDHGTLLSSANLNEPVLGVEIKRPPGHANWDFSQLAVLTPVGVRVFRFAQSKFTRVGSVDLRGVQSVAWSPDSLAVSTRDLTLVLR